jgi:hypothetical protein
LAGLATLLVIGRPTESASALDSQVKHFQALQQERSPSERHRDVSAKIEQLTRFEKAPAFAALPTAQQRYVRQQLQELAAFQRFESDLNALPDPQELRHESELTSLQRRLRDVPMPAEYRDEWEQTEAGRRRAAWLSESAALETALQRTRADYQTLLRDGQQVVRTLDAPNLPRRAKAVLDRAAAMPDPRKDQDKLIPGAQRVTYRAVFGFASLDEVYRQWEEVRKVLEPFARQAEKT